MRNTIDLESKIAYSLGSKATWKYIFTYCCFHLRGFHFFCDFFSDSMGESKRCYSMFQPHTFGQFSARVTRLPKFQENSQMGSQIGSADHRYSDQLLDEGTLQRIKQRIWQQVHRHSFHVWVIPKDHQWSRTLDKIFLTWGSLEVGLSCAKVAKTLRSLLIMWLGSIVEGIPNPLT